MEGRGSAGVKCRSPVRPPRRTCPFLFPRRSGRVSVVQMTVRGRDRHDALHRLGTGTASDPTSNHFTSYGRLDHSATSDRPLLHLSTSSSSPPASSYCSTYSWAIVASTRSLAFWLSTRICRLQYSNLATEEVCQRCLQTIARKHGIERTSFSTVD